VDSISRGIADGTVHGQMTVANDHRILAVVSVTPWFDRQMEERSFVTTTSRVMSGHCSIQARLERFRIVEDPICVCMMVGSYDLGMRSIWLASLR
jgi:hypothetical protein